jgi:hypothetical protein
MDKEITYEDIHTLESLVRKTKALGLSSTNPPKNADMERRFPTVKIPHNSAGFYQLLVDAQRIAGDNWIWSTSDLVAMPPMHYFFFKYEADAVQFKFMV